MQKVEGGEDRKPTPEELESEVAKEMRAAGTHRAHAEDGESKGVVDKLQKNTSKIKDAAAEKMDQLGGREGRVLLREVELRALRL